jgi:protein O-GlcNAc transferase
MRANLFASAVDHFRAGRVAEAEQACRDALKFDPDHFDSLHLLGVISYKTGRSDVAVDIFGKAIASNGASAECHHNLGLALVRLDRIDEATAHFTQAVALDPTAVAAHVSLGNALKAEGKLDDAAVQYRRALALKPDYTLAQCNLGNVLREQGKLDEAITQYRLALGFEPRSVMVLSNLAKTLDRKGEADDALATYRRALALKPNDPELHNDFGNLLWQQGRLDDADTHYQRALALKPDFVEAFYNRGGAAQAADRHDEALASFDKALALKPDYAKAHYARGHSLHVTNRWQEALESFAKVLSLEPDHAEAKFAMCMAELPILYAHESEIAERRAGYEKRVQALSDDIDRSGMAGNLVRGVGSSQPFYLGYQGINDRDLQGIYGSLICRIMAEHYPPATLSPPPGPDEPVRVGFVSGHFRFHTVWKLLTKGWLSQLDRRRFQIFGYCTGANEDAETRAAVTMCDRFVRGPLSTDRWRQAILSDAPHVLIYPEVGMDPVSVQLAAQRLAPVQCNSWGHPDTSGFPTLDYFLSSELMEPADGQDHYTERLVRFPNLSIYYEPLEAPPHLVGRSQLGLRSTATVYWCGQSLFKYLPQFDEVFPRIAQEAGDCQFAFIQSPISQIADAFRNRLDQAFAAFGLRAADYCILLPRLDQQRFIAAVGQCDVVLDSIGWSGGNTTLEGLAHDVPVVTMTGNLMRGRHTTAILKMMDVTETITETIDDYVSTAARLARDVSWRKAIASRMSASKHRIYRDRSCISALEEFLNRVVRRGDGRQ